MLEVSSLKKRFQTEARESVSAVADVSFHSDAGQIFTLLGPSGCGKSTTLRMIAGLEMPDHGEIRIGAELVYSAVARTNVPANRRNLGMVFQSYAIWPHMTVFENAAFPLRAKKRELGLSGSAISDRVSSVLSTVSLDGLESRQATSLSGGQQQRLALARAIVTEPPVILLDEPLSNLDAKLRERMRDELRRLQRELGVAMVYVTHDQAEALALSHRIAVMKDGEIIQVGTPAEIYQTPRTAFVAEFVGKTNFIDGRVDQTSAAGVTVATALGPLQIATDESHAPGDRVKVAFRPEHVAVSSSPPDGAHTWAAKIRTLAYYGAFQEIDLVANNTAVTAIARSDAELVPERSVYAQIDGANCVLVR